MVFNKERIIPGLFILIIILFFYFNNFDIIFFFTLSFFIFYDFFYSKIISTNLAIPLLMIILSFFFLNNFNYDIFYIHFLFIFFFVLSIVIKKYLKSIFIILIFLYLFYFYEIINFDRNLIYIIIFISFLNDTSALIIGNSFKGPLIIPKISPKKTWSGTIGSIIVSFIFLLVLDFNLFISFLISILLFFGDIYFSYIKRILKIKDFSNLLKGHGGILDRLDSTFFVIFLINLISI
tara:strand:+ start:633 stop:1340 length:708 start_codon:yes stop_codon:yes gene_type:complete